MNVPQLTVTHGCTDLWIIDICITHLRRVSKHVNWNSAYSPKITCTRSACATWRVLLRSQSASNIWRFGILWCMIQVCIPHLRRGFEQGGTHTLLHIYCACIHTTIPLHTPGFACKELFQSKQVTGSLSWNRNVESLCFYVYVFTCLCVYPRGIDTLQ